MAEKFEVRGWDDEPQGQVASDFQTRGWDDEPSGLIDSIRSAVMPMEAGPDEATLGTSMQRGIGQVMQAGNVTTMSANRRVLDVLDRIDRGESVRDVDDPIGYGQMDPETRKVTRAQLEKTLAGNVAGVARHQQAMETIPESPAVKRVVEAKSFGEGWDAFMQDPVGVVAHLGAQSLPAMAPGLVGAAVAGPVGGVVAGSAAMGAGSYGVEYASGIAQALQEDGVNLSDPAAIQAAIADPAKMRRIRERAATKATLVGGLDAASGGLASKTLIPGRRTLAKEAANMAAQAPAQGALGAAGEAIGAAASGEEVKPGAVLAEFFGEFAGAPAEVASMMGARRPPADPLQDAAPIMQAETVEDAIAEAERVMGDDWTRAPSEDERARERMTVDYETPDVAAMQAQTAAEVQPAAPVGNEIEFNRPEVLGIIDQVRGPPRARDELAAELQREPAPLEPPEIVVPGQQEKPDAALEVPQAPPGDALAQQQRQYADALAKQQRGELLSSYETSILRGPPPAAPRAPIIVAEGSYSSKTRGAREPAQMTEKELDLAVRLTRSPERRESLQAEIDRRGDNDARTVEDSPQPSPSEPAGAAGVSDPIPAQTEAPVERPAQAPDEVDANVSISPAATTAATQIDAPVSIAAEKKGDGASPPPASPGAVESPGVPGTPPGLATPAQPAPSPEGVAVPAPQFRDYTAPKTVGKVLKGEVRTFKTEKSATAFQKQQKLRGFAPRKTEDGWVLSKPIRARTAAQMANDRRLRERATNVLADDDLLTMLAKAGGVRQDEVDGADPADIASVNKGRFAKAFRRGGGMTLDGAAEFLSQHGYDVFDEQGSIDATKARELIDRALSGESVYSPEGHELRASAEAQAREEANRAAGMPDGVDRRTSGSRPDPESMSPEELRAEVEKLRKEARTDAKTGLPNLHAWKEARERDPQQFVVAMDVDSLGWINDNMGHDGGDQLLNAVARALEAAGVQAYRTGGDEIMAQANDLPDMDQRMERAAEILATAEVTGSKDGTRYRKTGVGLSYGYGTDEKSADEDLYRSKERRVARGLRPVKGTEPPGVAREPAGATGQARSDAPRVEVDETPADAGVSASTRQPDAPQTDKQPGTSELRLTGETEAEIRARETREKAEADERAKIAKAPDPADFALTGSERMVDVARAAGQRELVESSPPASDISDFGEKIGGARKDTYQSKMAEALSVDVLAEPLSKSWPAPDYQAMLDAGADPWAVAFMRAARDEIPPKPHKPWKVKQWAEMVKGLRDTAFKLADGSISNDYARRLLANMAKTSRGMDALASRIELYEAVGHKQSLDGVRVSVGEYSLYNGVTYNPARVIWTVEKETKATAFSNWPRELATGRTKEEAIAAFKAKYDSLEISPPASKEVSFDIFSKRGEDGYWVGKKIGRNPLLLAGPFPTIKEARAYKTENNATLVAKLEKAKEIPKERRDTNEPRVGEDMRNGQDVTPEMFAESFGFRGVEFGNWVEQGKRQRDLNDAYDALMDMAAIIGVPPKALSLNGELGLAFGARGSGGIHSAAAHYERDFVVINLTKKEGAGAIGHEWWHALDNYFSRMRGKKDDYATEALDTSLASRGSRYVHSGAVRKEMIDAFGQVISAIRKTAVQARSSKLDAKRTKAYWTTTREMTARAFESYLISKLQDQNASNDYLANIVDEATWKAAESMGFELDDSYPYPTAGEVPDIRAGFDKFFSAIQVREENGRPVMFRRGTERSSGLTPESFRASLVDAFGERAAKALIDRGVIKPVENNDALPSHIVPYVREGDVIFGFYDPKTDAAYAVLENLSPEMVRGLVMHEIGVHYGFERMLGPKLYAEVMQRLEAMLKASNKDVQTAREAAERESVNDSQVPEETLAYLIQNRPELGLVKRIVAAIKAWAFREFGIGATKLTVDDLAALAQAAVLRAAEGQDPIMSTEEQPAWHRAYHGTPHEVDRFSTKFIGTGEGAQAYGWGLYFAGRREVAEYYREALKDRNPNRLTVDGRTIPPDTILGRSLIDVVELSKDAALQKIDDNIRFNETYAPSIAATYRDVRAQIADISPERIVFNRGRLYEVELAPKEDEYLDWDKPLSEQSEKVRAAIEKLPDNARPLDEMEWQNVTGQRLYHRVSVYTDGRITSSDPETGSRRLAAAGIPGIKYLDGSSRRTRPSYTGDPAYLAAARDFKRNDVDIQEALKGLMRAYPDALAKDLWPALNEAYDQQPKAHHNYVIFDDKHVDVVAKFSRARPEWAKGNAALESAVGKVDTFKPEATIREKVKGLSENWKLRLVQGIFDAYAPLKRLGHTEYVKARMVKSVDGALEGLLLYGKPVMGEDGAIHGDIDRKGFLGAMQDLKGEHDRFLLWVAGNRAERLMGEDREHLFTKDEVKALKRLDEGKMKDGSARKEAYNKAAVVLRDYNKAVLDIAEKTGLIDAESRHLWEHDFYVPFFRVEEDATIAGPTRVKGLVRQQAFKKLKGGEEPLGDLLENTLRNWSHLLSASMANQAAVASLQAAEKLGIAEQVPEGTRDATFAMVGGKKVHYAVNDPLVMQAISAMESASFKGLPMKVMGKFKHYLTLGVTVSPTFRIRNLMRDSLSAIGQNEMSYNVVSNLYQGFKGTNRNSDEYAQMLFNGAMMRFGQLTDGKHAEHAKRLIAAGVDDSTILTNPEKVKAALGKMWDAWQEFGDRMENVNRTALYKQMKAEGKSDIEAAFAARDMIDFSLQGSWVAVRFLTQIVPFMNARLQGMYKLGRAAQQDPARLGYVAGAVSLASIALLLAYGDDDEWKKREDWDRDAFWWFRIGNTAYRIPKPFEIGAIGTLAERSVELMMSDEMTGKRFGERMKSMVGDTFALNPIPQLFKPMLDLYSNVDSFTGRQIESRGMQNLSKPERATPYTSLVAKLVGKAGNVTGLSPVQVDHLIRAYFGWLGSHAAMTVDLAAQPFMEAKPPSRRLGDVFVIGDFVKDLPSDRSRYVEQFYKQAKVIHEVMGDLRLAREAKDSARVAEILSERKSDLALSRLYTQAERQMSAINKDIRLVHSSKKAPEQKRMELDRLNARRNDLARVVEMRAMRRREAVGQ